MQKHKMRAINSYFQTLVSTFLWFVPFSLNISFFYNDLNLQLPIFRMKCIPHKTVSKENWGYSKGVETHQNLLLCTTCYYYKRWIRLYSFQSIDIKILSRPSKVQFVAFQLLRNMSWLLYSRMWRFYRGIPPNDFLIIQLENVVDLSKMYWVTLSSFSEKFQ